MIKMQFEGGDQLARNLALMRDRASKKLMREALIEGAEPMRGAIAAAAPRDPGAPDLADHIAINAARARGGDAAAAKVGPTKESRSDQPGRTYDVQAYQLQYGTVYMAAQPFMLAGRSAMGAALNIIRGAIWRGLAAAGISTRGSGGSGGLE